MRLNTVKFGEIEVDDNKAIHFVSSILGFSDSSEFVLLEHPVTSPIYWLQSVQAAELAFPVVDPFLLVVDYDFEVSPGVLAELGTERVEDICTLTIVVLTPEVKDIRTNLRAPILYNPEAGLAKQVVLEGTDYPVQFHFARSPKAEPCPSESLNVGA